MTHSEDQFPYDRFPDEAEDFVPGANLFLGTVPRLRKLVLQGVFIDPAWPPLAQLRTLNLEYSMYARGHVITLDAFLQLLARMPLLEELLTEKALVEPADSSIDLDLPPPTGVTLHRLRELTLDEDAPIFLALLRALSFPPLERLHITIRAETDKFLETAARFGSLLRPHVDAVATRLARSHVGLLLLWPALVVHDGPLMPLRDAWLNISFGHPRDPYASLIAAVPFFVPMDSIMHLEVPCKAWQYGFPDDPFLSVVHWETLLAQLPNLQTLSARAEHGCTVVDALSGPRAHALCPALHTLTLRVVPLRRRVNGARSLLEALPGLVFARQQLGRPLAVLRLRGVHPLAIEAARATLGARIDQIRFEGIPVGVRGGGDLERWPAPESEAELAEEVRGRRRARLAVSLTQVLLRRNCCGQDGRMSVHLIRRKPYEHAARHHFGSPLYNKTRAHVRRQLSSSMAFDDTYVFVAALDIRTSCNSVGRATSRT
jgi:hypothetical protein